MANALLVLLIFYAVMSTLYAGEHRSRYVSLDVKIDSYQKTELPEGNKSYTINFNAEALERFRSCFLRPDTLSCCTKLTKFEGMRQYGANSKDFHCIDLDEQIKPDVSADVFECYVNLAQNFDATSIKCAKVIPKHARDGKHSPTLWLSFLETNGSVPCVDVMWGSNQTVQDVRPFIRTSTQQMRVILKRGRCPNVPPEPTQSVSSSSTAKTAKSIRTTSSTTTTTLISTSEAKSHRNIKNDSPKKDNKSLILIIGVPAAVVVIIIIIVIISVVIWRRKKHQKIPITCNTASYEYIDTTELVSQRDRNIEEAVGNPAVSSSTPLKKNNKRNKIEGNRSNAVVDTYVSPEEIIRNKRAATAAACGGGGDVTGNQGTEFISNNDTDHYTVPSLQLVSGNTQDSHYETQYDNVETSAQDSTSSATNIYSRLGEQVRNFQNPYSDLKNFKLNATTKSCPADVNPSEPSMTTSTENVGPTVQTEPARQPFISTDYEYVDI